MSNVCPNPTLITNRNYIDLGQLCQNMNNDVHTNYYPIDINTAASQYPYPDEHQSLHLIDHDCFIPKSNMLAESSLCSPTKLRVNLFIKFLKIKLRFTLPFTYSLGIIFVKNLLGNQHKSMRSVQGFVLDCIQNKV